MHLNPLIFEFFQQKAVFFKDGNGLYNAYSQVRPLEAATITHCTPTCVNLALSFSLRYGAQHIFLFGTDFGFFNLEEHHANGSVYYKENIHEMFKEAVDYTQYTLFEIESVQGEPILTQPLYFAAKERTENCIKYYRHAVHNQHHQHNANNLSQSDKNQPSEQKPAHIYNCSDGAKIEGTEWIRPDADAITLDVIDRQVIDQAIASLLNPSQRTSHHNVIEAIRQQGAIELGKSANLLKKPLMLPPQHPSEFEHFDALSKHHDSAAAD